MFLPWPARLASDHLIAALVIRVTIAVVASLSMAAFSLSLSFPIYRGEIDLRTCVSQNLDRGGLTAGTFVCPGMPFSVNHGSGCPHQGGVGSAGCKITHGPRGKK